MRALQVATRAAAGLRPRAPLRGPSPSLPRSAAGANTRRLVHQATLLDEIYAAPTAADAAANAPTNGAAAQPVLAPPEQPQPQPEVMPADDDAQRFQLHWSVDMWKPFYPSRWLEGIGDPSAPVPDRIRAFTETLTNAVGTAGILGSTEAARYWAYHLTRSGFFMVQGLASLLVTRRAVGRDTNAPSLTRFEEMVRNSWSGPATEAMLMFWQDHENIKEGRYALPWDMTTPGHRQYNPLYILQRGAAFLQEAVATLRRRDVGVPDQVWLKSGYLPEYYQSTFHYQSDGWLSATSAKVYETSTETLFVGRQDAMQRCTLVPLSDFMRGKDASQLQALEVAAGTGRFATFLKDNYLALPLTVSDLSPFYLAEAKNNMEVGPGGRLPLRGFVNSPLAVLPRPTLLFGGVEGQREERPITATRGPTGRLCPLPCPRSFLPVARASLTHPPCHDAPPLQYWKRMRAPDANFGGRDGIGVTFLQTAAEKLDVPDNSQDIVYCIYLFHELPADVRKQAVAEMARVVRPGGIVVLTDSMQLGDRNAHEKTMGRFGSFNEPYYEDYIATPLGPLFEAAGLKCGMKVLGSTTKTLSFYKPTQDDRFAAAGSSEAGAAAAAAEVAAEAQQDE
ncbi:hypothetical protein ABPG75_007464 [Micractinium tetrahymenae]